MSIFSSIVLVLALLLLLTYIFYEKIIRIIASLTKLIFFLGFFGLIYVILFPGLHHKSTGRFLEDQYLTEQLLYADSTINKFYDKSSLVKNTWNRIRGDEESAPLKSRLQATFIDFISGGLQLFIGLLSLIFMLFGIYVRVVFSGGYT